jgi:hypothetical protein
MVGEEHDAKIAIDTTSEINNRTFTGINTDIKAIISAAQPNSFCIMLS